jgi:hypothetical protein
MSLDLSWSRKKKNAAAVSLPHIDAKNFFVIRGTGHIGTVGG